MPRPADSLPRPLRTAAWTLGAWTLVGAAALGSHALTALAHARPLPGGGDVLRIFASVWLWALFTPFVLAATRRFPLMGAHWQRHVVPHVVLFVVLWGVDGVASAGVDGLVTRTSRPLAGHLMAGLWQAVYSQLGLLALAHALRFHRLSVERQVRASELEAQLLRSQLHALQVQLHPHFLFNALHTVSALVRTDDKQGALQTVAALAELLRTVLRSDAPQEVPLRQELALLERYLHIERLRFGDRLHTRFHVAPGAEDALVPQLLLQPLVENAVRHGTRDDGARNAVEVDVRREGGELCLSVRDSGGGGGPGRRDGQEPSGIGLANTRARLRHLYGEHQRLALQPAPGGGTLAQVVIPFRAARPAGAA